MEILGDVECGPNTGLCRACLLFLLGAATVATSPAQIFTTLVNFDGTNGNFPGALVQGIDGNFYGTTGSGGACGFGTIFKMTPGGTLKTLLNFCESNGATPEGLILASDGNFYGTTFEGGASGACAFACGTVFKFTSSGTLTTLYSFCAQANCADGAAPQAPLIQATNGNFYGTTSAGGANGFGTVFEITAEGKLTTLYSFCSQANCADGAGPLAGLVQGTNGNFYGTNYFGTPNDAGTAFEITAEGKLTTLYTFCSQNPPVLCSDGSQPLAALIQARDGNFYGTTYTGGSTPGGGTVFKLTPTGQHTIIHSFCARPACADGSLPVAGLIQASDGNFYGTTLAGGNASGAGTVFEITPGGTVTTLHSFCLLASCPDGSSPRTSLVQGTNGKLYGTTTQGGKECANACGTVLALIWALYHLRNRI